MNTNTNRPVLIKRVSTVSPGHFDEELRCYDAHLRDVRGLALETRRNYVRVAGCLLHRKFAAQTFDLSGLRAADVQQFIAGEPDAILKRYRVPDTLIDFLRNL